jgi:hypothetical protein
LSKLNRHPFPGQNTEDREALGNPLDDVEEYALLFPEDDDRASSAPTQTLARTPDVLARHQFPGQDVWKDTQDSMMYQTTVDTSQDEDQSNKASDILQIFSSLRNIDLGSLKQN